MKNFLKAFFSFGLATSIEKILGFILLPIYTRQFNKMQFGVIDMTGTVLAVASIFGLLQLETALQRFYYEYGGLKRKLLISNIYFWIGGCSFVIGLTIFFLAPQISQWLFKAQHYAELIRISAFQLPLLNLGMLGLVLLRFERQNNRFLIVVVTKVVCSLFFIFLFVIRWQWGLSGVFYAQLLAIFLATALVTYFVKDLFVFRFSKMIFWKSFKYSLPQFPARVGSMVLDQANRFFMLGFLSLAAIGIFSVSMKLASSVQLVNSAFILTWAPFMHAQFKNKNNKTVFASVFPIVAGGTFLCVCLISLFSKEMVQLLATEEFYISYKYVGGLALFFSLYIIKETIDIGPKIKERTKYLSYSFFLSMVVNICSLYFFIQMFQIEGVVFSMILTNLFLISVSWFISNRLYYIPFSIPYFVILLIPVLLMAALSMFVELVFFQRLLISVLCTVFYGILLHKFYRNFRITFNKRK